MTIGKIIRLMDSRDLFDVPEARKEFEKHGHQGNYFFFVIKNYKITDEEEIVGYLMAIKEDKKAVVRKVQLLDMVDTAKEKEIYRNTAISNLYDYVKEIKGTEGKREVFQVCVI